MEKVKFEDTVLGSTYEEERVPSITLKVLIAVIALAVVVVTGVMLFAKGGSVTEEILSQKLVNSEYWFTYENREDTDYGYSEQYFEIRFAEDDTAELLKYIIYHVNDFDRTVGYDLPDGTHLDSSFTILPLEKVDFTYKITDSTHFTVSIEGRTGECECDMGEDYFTDDDSIICDPCWLFSREN